MPGVPNSAMLAAAGIQDSGGMGSDALRQAMQVKLTAMRHQIPAAEAEADRLSRSVAGTTPEQVRSEMGTRLGADFSGVRFHTDAASASRAEKMGARAWTQGNDVYFGPDGFNPSTAAHELVHTVQQGAVAGGVSTVSAPMGAVQMELDDDLVRLFAFFNSGINKEEKTGKINSKTIPKALKDAVGKKKAKALAQKEADWADKWMQENATAEVFQAINGRMNNLNDKVMEEYDFYLKNASNTLGGEKLGPGPADARKARAAAKAMTGNDTNISDLSMWQAIVGAIGTNDKTFDYSLAMQDANKASEMREKESGKLILDSKGAMMASYKGLERSKINDIADQGNPKKNPLLNGKIAASPKEKAALEEAVRRQKFTTKNRMGTLMTDNLRKRGVIK